MWEVRFKDIDPDTGDTSQDKLIATCVTEDLARWVHHALEVEMDGDDPNRDFYIQKEE